MFVIDIFVSLLLASVLTGLYFLGRRGQAGRWAVGTAYGLAALFAVWLVTPAILSAHWLSYGFLAVAVVLVAGVLMSSKPQLASQAGMTDPAARRTAFAACLFFSISALVFLALIVVRAGIRYSG